MGGGLKSPTLNERLQPGAEVDIEADLEHQVDDTEHEENAYHGAHNLDEHPESCQRGGGGAACDESGIPAAEKAALGCEADERASLFTFDG